ncbi:enolase C-terminal domain-like protein [Paenibacillus sp. FSL H7-0331]|uniref:enolase C-terminal domain-like protein n=1 Tax=Paenibacillus sp. FSL H7-0331 TaxID=1920421 RepID=UPI00096DC3FB|nr:enolase C-terminal domain-like protein [Paenibacillus sp. FSL H7-0331]OMF12401.1 hypothetical protein BK127_23320 [Paenibacillus sp. FSL H7-0331]
MTLKVMEQLSQIQHHIESIEVYRYDVDVQRNFSHGSWSNRIHGFIRITAAGQSGWGENIIAVNQDQLDLKAWLDSFQPLIGMRISDGIAWLMSHLQQNGSKATEMLETALVDLAGKLLGVQAIALLGLEGTEAVPGLYCILENDTEVVKEKARLSLEQGYRTHLKVKLFGDIELDKAVVIAARSVIGEEAFLVGDVNDGYRKKQSTDSLDDLTAAMLQLHAVGLNACEDPGSLSTEQWIELQNRVDGLQLLPDAPLRPAVTAIQTAAPGMGGIYNIHPGCAGSLIHAVELARTIQGFGAKLMIGDDSLVGPACTVWQQLAIGLGADWVEALEKPGESEGFESCILTQATSRSAEGQVCVTEPAAGFGLYIDQERLLAVCKDYYRISQELTV